MTTAMVVAALACGFLCGLAVWAAVATSRRRRPRQAQREAAIRSALYRSLDDPNEPSRILDSMGSSDRKLLEAKARALLPALRGEDRETLARLLESRGATEAARRQCRSRRASSRAAACGLLGEVGSSFALLDLVPLLEDPRPSVRMAATKALGRLGQPAGVIPLMGAVAGRRVPLDAAADAIHQIRDWPVSLLHPCLSDPSEPTRALAVELVGRFHDLESVDILLGVLSDDSSPGVRVRAARALGRIGSPRSVDALVACVHVGPSSLRTEAISALGRMGAVAAVPSLRAALLGPSLPLSLAAATALSAITPKGIAVLEEISIDRSHPAAAVARRALDVALVPEQSLPW